MANFLRVMVRTIAVAILMASGVVNADTGFRLTGAVTYTSAYSLECQSALLSMAGGIGSISAPTLAALVDLVRLAIPSSVSCNSGAVLQGVNSSSNEMIAAVFKSSNGAYSQDIRFKYAGFTCPAGETWDGATQQCQPPECPQGQVRNPWFGSCQEECPDAGGVPSRSHVTSGNAVCLHGCKRTRAAHPGGSTCVRSLELFAGGGSELICDYAYTGEMCGWFGELAGDTSEPGEGEPPGEQNPDPPDEPCPAGMQTGTFNGRQVCLKAGDTTSQEQTTTADTTTTSTSNNTTTNVNTASHTSTNFNSSTNTTIVTTTTTTTTTTTNNETNETTTTTTTEVSQQELPGNQSTIPGNGGAPNGEDGATGECDPALQDCGSLRSSFAGSCGEPPLCLGDALQCAIARHTHETQCAVQTSQEVMDAWAAIREFQGTGDGDGLDRKQIDVPTALEVSEVGGGAGLSDQSFTVMGQSIVIPFSEMNRFIAILGYAIMVIAWIGAWRIIVGAF